MIAILSDLQVVIVGAGIGGLAAGIGFSRAGFTNVVIYENARDISEVRRQCLEFSAIFGLKQVVCRLELGYRCALVGAQILKGKKSI